MVASMPLDRNEAGQIVAEKKVIGSTLLKGRQMAFAARVASGM